MGAVRIPRLYAAASLKHRPLRGDLAARRARIPRLYAAASLKRGAQLPRHDATWWRIPRLYAAASLKLSGDADNVRFLVGYSAALCRGLIEASDSSRTSMRGVTVFRGFMPRPH